MKKRRFLHERERAYGMMILNLNDDDDDGVKSSAE